MSEHAVFVVRTDAVPPDVAAEVAGSVERWLSATGVVGQRDVQAGPVLLPDGARSWAPGPALGPASLAPERPAVGVVAVTAERQLYHPVGNGEPVRCGGCATPLPDDEDLAAVGTWLDEGEPVLACAACGWQAAYGDWPGDWSSAVGAPAVAFHLDADPTPELLAQVGRQLGGRTRVVVTRL